MLPLCVVVVGVDVVIDIVVIELWVLHGEIRYWRKASLSSD